MHLNASLYSIIREPDMPIDYSKGKIYRIEPVVEHDVGDVYYGSTCCARLCDRFKGHVSTSKNPLNTITSRLLFEKYGLLQCKIFLVEDFPCSTKDELTRRESHFIRNFACVNKKIPNLTLDETKAYNSAYYFVNKDKINTQGKVSYLENKDKINTQRKGHYLENKDEIDANRKSYRLSHADDKKTSNKAYYISHADDLKTYQTAYKLSHEDKIKACSKAYRLSHAEQIKEYYVKNKDTISAKSKASYLAKKEAKRLLSCEITVTY